jgi:hypothetical protein
MPNTYPGNVTPQFQSSNNFKKKACLKCPPDLAVQAAIFEDTELVITKGWERKSNIDLREFFTLLDNFSEYQVTLKPMDSDKWTKLTYGMVGGDDNSITFLAILPLWNYTNIDPMYYRLNWRFVNQPNDDFYALSKILILNAPVSNQIQEIELQNPTSSDITVKILIAK